MRTFISTLTTPSGSDVWLYIGGEAGHGVSDPANKWSRTGMAIDSNLWGSTSSGQQPNGPAEHCVVISEAYNGLLDIGCQRAPTASVVLNTLCEYFPD